MLLEMLKQGATGAMYDALRFSGRAAGEHDVEGMIERECAKLHGPAPSRVEQLAPVQHALGQAEIHIRHDHDLLHARQLLDDSADPLTNIEGLAVVLITVAGDQDFRIDLGKAVQQALLAEVRGCRREDSAQRAGSEHRNDRLGDIG